MVDLAPGSVVSVVNPNAVVRVTMPGLVNGLWLKEGPAGIGIPAGGDPGQALVKGAGGDFDTEWSDAGSGDVVGPATAVADRLAVFNGTTGKIIKDGGIAVAALAPLASPAFTGTPTGITKTHVGLGNVDNTSDASKPVSTATQTALDLKAPLASPTFTGTVAGVTKTHVGLGNVDNTSDAAKPVSTATQTALNLKANLASPTLTGTPLAPTAATATNTTQIATTAYVKAQAYATLASPTFTGTVAGITKSMVGLGSVDNTADTAKPVSTAQQTALDLKLTKASNLSDLGSASTARTNLGLGTAATVNTGTTSGTIPTLNASGRIATARLGSGTADSTKVLAGDESWIVLPGTILDYAVWTNGGVTTSLALSGNAATLVTINAALQVSFVAPASGAVVVTMCATYTPDTAGSGSGAWWGLLSSGTPVVGSSAEMGSFNAGARRTTHTCVIAGLTPGNTCTWDWAWAGNEDGFSELWVGAGTPSLGDVGGPMVMTVAAL